MCFLIQLNVFLTASQSLLPINQLVANLISLSGLQQKVFLLAVRPARAVQACPCVSQWHPGLPGGHTSSRRERPGCLYQICHHPAEWPWISHLSSLGQVPHLQDEELNLATLQVFFHFWALWIMSLYFLCYDLLLAPQGRQATSRLIFWAVRSCRALTQLRYNRWLWESESLLQGGAPSEHHLLILWQLRKSNIQCFEFLLQKWKECCTLLAIHKTLLKQLW